MCMRVYERAPGASDVEVVMMVYDDDDAACYAESAQTR